MTNDDLFSEIESILSELDVSDLPCPSTMATGDLLNRCEDLTDELSQRKELLHPHTQEARDLHSERYAVRIELMRRGIVQ